MLCLFRMFSYCFNVFSYFFNVFSQPAQLQISWDQVNLVRLGIFHTKLGKTYFLALGISGSRALGHWADGMNC